MTKAAYYRHREAILKRTSLSEALYKRLMSKNLKSCSCCNPISPEESKKKVRKPRVYVQKHSKERPEMTILGLEPKDQLQNGQVRKSRSEARICTNGGGEVEGSAGKTARSRNLVERQPVRVKPVNIKHFMFNQVNFPEAFVDLKARQVNMSTSQKHHQSQTNFSQDHVYGKEKAQQADLDVVLQNDYFRQCYGGNTLNTDLKTLPINPAYQEVIQKSRSVSTLRPIPANSFIPVSTEDPKARYGHGGAEAFTNYTNVIENHKKIQRMLDQRYKMANK